MKKPNKNRRKICFAILAIGVLAIMVVLAWMIVGDNHDNIKIETPYCTLMYPKKWEKYIVLEEIDQEDKYTISFLAKIDDYPKQKLFDISIGQQLDTCIGVLVRKNEVDMYVDVKLYPFTPMKDWPKDTCDVIYGMQEDLNYIIKNLHLSQNEETTEETILENEQYFPEVTETLVFEDIAVETPYGVFYYPGNWIDILQIRSTDETGHMLDFYAVFKDDKEQLLFRIRFDKSEVGNLGVIKQTDGSIIGVSLETIQWNADNTWSDEELDTMYRMQEAANYLIDTMKLSIYEHPNSTLETEYQEVDASPIIEDSNELVIETPYVDMVCSGTWLDNLRIEHNKVSDYTVTFYGSIGNHDGIKLFAIVFGDSKGTIVGNIVDKSGEEVFVSLEVPEINFGEGWQEEEKNMVYEMQEKVNELLINMGIS